MAPSKAPFWTKSSDEMVEELNSNLDKGLTQDEINERMKKAGANTIAPNSHAAVLEIFTCKQAWFVDLCFALSLFGIFIP